MSCLFGGAGRSQSGSVLESPSSDGSAWGSRIGRLTKNFLLSVVVGCLCAPALLFILDSLAPVVVVCVVGAGAMLSLGIVYRVARRGDRRTEIAAWRCVLTISFITFLAVVWPVIFLAMAMGRAEVP